jgi:hypothetical protein
MEPGSDGDLPKVVMTCGPQSALLHPWVSSAKAANIACHRIIEIEAYTVSSSARLASSIEDAAAAGDPSDVGALLGGAGDGGRHRVGHRI